MIVDDRCFPFLEGSAIPGDPVEGRTKSATALSQGPTKRLRILHIPFRGLIDSGGAPPKWGGSLDHFYTVWGYPGLHVMITTVPHVIPPCWSRGPPNHIAWLGPVARQVSPTCRAVDSIAPVHRGRGSYDKMMAVVSSIRSAV